VLQRVAACCSQVMYDLTHLRVCTCAVYVFEAHTCVRESCHMYMLQHVAACCSMLQCVAVYVFEAHTCVRESCHMYLL